jgi:anti-sigma regulatory factor (Ser/Thr protein kinase)
VICQLHSSVSSAPGADPIAIRDRGIAHEASREFQPMDSAPRAARRFVEDALRRWGHDGWAVDDARLLVSELVTNAVIHTRSPFSVSLESQPSRLRVAVHDESSAVPRSGGQTLETARGGRGLQIVATLADDWGVMATPAGKTVWAELSAL